ncbi:MAG: family 2 glycosyl transferase [Verrucomicrobiales bacterium]|nr:family 2 glycosyl transferase [Verrucomicrobiales bacterium]
MALNPDPIVSVIIPAFNAEAFIEETLKSVLHQTCSDIEILVVDDGSRDCTAAIIRGFADRDPRVKFFQQQNRGVAAARNFAIQNSTGKYIAPIDADDIWHPTKLEKQVAALERAGESAAVAYSWSTSIDEKGNVFDAGPTWDLEGEVYQALVLRNFIGNASVPLFRRSALQKVGFYNEAFRSRDAQGCEDWDICLRCAEKFEYRVVREYLVGYRCYSQSMSYNHVSMGRSYELVMQEVKKRHPEIPAYVYRWSKSIFYLYLTHKSNVCGDLRNSLRWLLGALREDKAVLLLPWVIRCLATRLARLGIATSLDLFGKDSSAWQQARPVPLEAPELLSYEEVVANREKLPKRLWDKVQLQRWVMITNHRSYSC